MSLNKCAVTMGLCLKYTIPTILPAVFTSEGMAKKLKRIAQIITFAGPGAHHHNGMAKHAIGTITLA
jgi:hypothetical protein